MSRSPLDDLQAVGVDVKHDAPDRVGRQEPVLDASSQAVLEDRVAEVLIGVGTVPVDRGRRQTELHRGIKVLEDAAPLGVRSGAAAMALVHDDEIEEVGRVVGEEFAGLRCVRRHVGISPGRGQPLVGREVDVG